MKDYDEKVRERREEKHKEMREEFINNLNALMYERNYSCQQLSINRKAGDGSMRAYYYQY